VREAEYHRLKCQALAEYHKKLEAIETVWKLAGVKDKSGKPAAANKRSGLTHEVRQIVQSTRGNFTLRDIETALKKADPKRPIRLPSLSTILLRLSGDSVIKIVTPGVGRQATVYANAEPVAVTS
jgi:hypothetical protein